MTFRLGLKTLSNFCHQLGTMLNAGLPVSRALTVMQRGARPEMRRVCNRLLHDIEQGYSLSEALDRQGRRFPVLLKRLTVVGEETGGMDAIFRQAGEYYAFVRQVWARFISDMIWPLMEYMMAIAVVAFLAYIVPEVLGTTAFGGLTPGMILLVGWGVLPAAILLYYAATRILGGRYVVHRIMMSVPVVAMIMRTMALSRFAWCMQLMTDAGVPLLKAVRWSCEATGNGVFIRKAEQMIGDLKGGETLTEAMERTHLFPYDFIELIQTAEESGSMPQMFSKLSEIYHDKTRTAFKVVGQVMFWLLWIIVAGIIIYLIFKLYGAIYGGGGVYDSLTSGVWLPISGSC